MRFLFRQVRSIFGATSAATIRWKSEPPASMSDDPTEALPPRGRSLRILVVEDHGDTLRVLARLLDHFGHEISLANGAQSALEMVESKEFDVVLSDIGLPDGSGYEVIAQAKRNNQSKELPLPDLIKRKTSGEARRLASISTLPNRSTSTSYARFSRRSVRDFLPLTTESLLTLPQPCDLDSV